MQDIKHEIIKILSEVTKKTTGQDVKPDLERSKDDNHGDYSSNIAMVIFARSKAKTPMELAEEIVEKFKIQNSKFKSLEKVEAVKPGFINLWLSKEYLADNLQEILEKKDKLGKTNRLEDKKIMIEFTDPNPFKEFHIGHLYSNIVGESLSRLLESQGVNAWRVCYQGDVGLHVAKALYGIFRLCHAELFSVSSLLGSKMMKQIEDEKLSSKIEFLGKAYALGARAYEEDEKAKKEIIELNKKIYDHDREIEDLYKKGRQWSLEYFDTIYKRLGTKFKKFYFESEAGDIGSKIVRDHTGDVFEKSDGAVIFNGEKHGLHNRVFLNSQGLPTYEAKELGLAPTKYMDFKYDQSIIVTGNEIIEYFKVLLNVLKHIYPDLAARTKHVAHGMVRLPKGKMSSRTGQVITGEWLLDEAKDRIQKAYPEMDEDTAEKVAVGAVKYAFLKSGIGRDIEFNFDESISLEGNSGPYLQYTFARTQSVLAKAGITNHELRIMNYEFEKEEELLLRAIHLFPEVVEEASDKFAPNVLCNYLFDLAQKYNLFYQKHKILESEEEGFRLGLSQSVGQVLKNGLNLLGISAPDRM
ncbi:MAG: Arginine-tRNA ligase [uncultured bacterium]|nr:MAG: Arginine-tRNA ligase [uncultured bacterium]OGH13469.1 MAG: arginine--tRNA ligase [Candidatus Levybacteria bacterium RIFCSPHIGHO2_01_FULL_38_26]